jgi:RNA polymerase sigma-70 factor (ECF subfamily)
MNGEKFKTNILPLRPAMLAIAVKMLGNHDDAQDAVQEIMLRMWEMRLQVARMTNPAGYAMQSLRNFCLDKLRAEKMTMDAALTYLPCDETPYSRTEQRDALTLVRQIVAALPRLQKTVMEMRDIEGYETEEIAAITGLQPAAVTVNLSRARKKVRDMFLKMNNYKKI